MSKYNVGDKFTIEIKELINGSNDKMLYKSDCYSIIFGEEQLDKLQKYNGSTISEDTLEMERMKVLNDGRNEVWELASKIQGLDCKIREKIYGIYKMPMIFEKFTPQEALAKLEAYEKEQNEIKKSDEVQTLDGSHKGVVTLVRNRGDFFVLWDNGTADIYKAHEVKKTGKRIDIQSLLEQIKE